MMKKIILLIITALAAPTASAELFWSDTSFTLLSGSGYEVGDDEKTVFTLEQASGHSWGSTFLFFDRLRDSNLGGHETYGEVGADFTVATMDEGGVVKNVYIATQVEFVDVGAPGDNYLYGAGVSLNVPGANYFNISLYQRSNAGADNNTQVTIVWAFPFADGMFMFDGFLDATNSSDDLASSINFTPQLKWDLGSAALDMKPGKLWLGIEYAHWDNKFGIENSDVPFDTDERATNLLLKWHM
jgi:nucleoside-specific outer membrane channel protein Tsx